MSGIFNQSKDQKSKTPEIEGTKVKIFFILEEQFDKGKISLEYYKTQEAILWEKYQFLGFSNLRRFLYAIGLPISLFICSFVLIFFSRFSTDKFVKKGSFITGVSFQFTSLYFIIWTIWPFDPEKYDFKENVYFNILIISSLILSLGFYFISKSLAYRKLEVRELISLTIILRKKLFKNIDKYESKPVAKIEKEKIDDRVYDTFEKVVE